MDYKIFKIPCYGSWTEGRSQCFITATLSIVAFILSAAVSVFSAVKLSGYADIISRNTKIGGLLAGTILLAVATSLPELTATISASVIGNADIAVGNGLGSIIFNIFFLFLLDIYLISNFSKLDIIYFIFL